MSPDNTRWAARQARVKALQQGHGSQTPYADMRDERRAREEASKEAIFRKIVYVLKTRDVLGDIQKEIWHEGEVSEVGNDSFVGYKLATILPATIIHLYEDVRTSSGYPSSTLSGGENGATTGTSPSATRIIRTLPPRVETIEYAIKVGIHRANQIEGVFVGVTTGIHGRKRVYEPFPDGTFKVYDETLELFDTTAYPGSGTTRPTDPHPFWRTKQLYPIFGKYGSYSSSSIAHGMGVMEAKPWEKKYDYTSTQVIFTPRYEPFERDHEQFGRYYGLERTNLDPVAAFEKMMVDMVNSIPTPQTVRSRAQSHQ
jgi:hypothetical protein